MLTNDDKPLLVFDIGMFDGADTRYYLDLGYRVVAVEANPLMCERASKSFARELENGALTLVNRAVTFKPDEMVELSMFAEDLGASTIMKADLSSRSKIASFDVRTTTISDLFSAHGVPYLMKVDIEGADNSCILPLNRDERPAYVTFEAGEDVPQLVRHLSEIGYTHFKAMNQCNFYALDNQRNWHQRLRWKLVDLAGFKEPSHVRLKGRFFLRGHSSGLVPWRGDGQWWSMDRFLSDWNALVDADAFEGCWYDIHARLENHADATHAR